MWVLGCRGTKGAWVGRDMSLEAGEASARQRGGVRASQAGVGERVGAKAAVSRDTQYSQGRSTAAQHSPPEHQGCWSGECRGLEPVTGGP